MRTQILRTLLAGTLLFAACKGKSGYEVGRTDKMASADTVSRADTATQPKLVKTADMNFKVKNVQQTGESIAALTASYNGMVMHHKMASAVERSKDIRMSDDSVMKVSSLITTAEMRVKIPSDKLEEFMNRVSHMGLYVNNRQMDIEDKSLAYLSAQLKLKNRRELLAQQKTGKVTIKDPGAVLNLKDDVVDEQINNKGIDDKVKNSVVSLSFFQSNSITKEVIVNDDPSAYDEPFFKRIAMAIENGWMMFKVLLIAMTNLWVLFAAGIGLWFIIKAYRRSAVLPVKG